MDIQAKKLELIEWLRGLKDEKILQQIENVKSELDWWQTLSPEEKSLINQGIQDLEDGNTHSSESIRKSIRNRIKKRSA